MEEKIFENGLGRILNLLTIKSFIRKSMKIRIDLRFLFATCLLAVIVFCAPQVFGNEQIPDNTHLERLNKQLVSENILDYFQAYHEVNSFTYEMLETIRDQRRPTVALNDLVERVLREKLDTHAAKEDIFVNNIPPAFDAPFYENDEREHNIKYLNPQSEYVFLDNLKLKYIPQPLLVEDGSLWFDPTINKAPSFDVPVPGRAGERKREYSWGSDILNMADHRWSFSVPDDRRVDYIWEPRQRVKKYEEELIDPYMSGEIALTRNEHQIFAVDRHSGEFLWSMGGAAQQSYENYWTFRPFHQNSYGKEMLVTHDMAIAELDGVLTAVSLKDPLRPGRVWERSLGEYTLATKPVQVGALVIIGLINARQELWFCGFDMKTGVLAWSRYIGLSSFFSPVSVIAAVEGSRVWIGTNHGVLVCLNGLTGSTDWVRKYSPKKYSLFKYWDQGEGGDTIRNVGSILYDTQFIEMGPRGALYYKPRESDYFYVLSAKDGRIRKKIEIDPKAGYILTAGKGRAVFLKRFTGDGDIHAEVHIMDLDSGQRVNKFAIKEGCLKGVIRLSDEAVLFKVDDMLHFLRFGIDRIEHKVSKVSLEGWLVGRADGGVFISLNNSISYFDLSSFAKNDVSEPVYADRLEHRANVKGRFIQAIQRAGEGKTPVQIPEDLVSEMELMGVPLKDLFPSIVDHVEVLRQPAWQGIVSALLKVYGHEIILFHDVSIRFDNFLKAGGVPIGSKASEQSEALSKNKVRMLEQKLRTRGEYIIPVPIEVIAGSAQPDFFLISFFDQIVCVGEDGNIRWQRKVFFVSRNYNSVNSYSTFKDSTCLFFKNLKAYLYKGILIINDDVNVVGIDARTGDHVWSMTNQDDLFKGALQNLPVAKRLWPLEASQLFVERIKFRTDFLGNKIIVTHANSVFSVDPLTGFCDKKQMLDVDGVAAEVLGGGHIFLLSSALDQIITMNKELEIEGRIAINELGLDKAVFPKMHASDRYLILNVGPQVYVFDHAKKTLVNSFSVEKESVGFLELYRDQLLVINPASSIISYDYTKAPISTNWRFDIDLSKAHKDHFVMVGKSNSSDSEYYAISNDSIMILSGKAKKYSLVYLDILTGKKHWETILDDVTGGFFSMSNIVCSEGMLTFLLTTVPLKMLYENGDTTKPHYSTVSLDLDIRLFRIQVTDGKIIRNERGPSFSSATYQKSLIAESRHVICCGFRGWEVLIERK